MKGLIVEDNSIDLIAEVLGYGMLFKNEQYFEDDHLTGTPDIIIPKKDTVIDAKSSWDIFTFPLFDTSVPNMDYWWQGQGIYEFNQAKPLQTMLLPYRHARSPYRIRDAKVCISQRI